MKRGTIEAGLEFSKGTIDRVVRAFITLPVPLRPSHFSYDENVRKHDDQIDDKKRFTAFLARSQSGFFLCGEAVAYSIRIASGKPTICDCFLDLEPEDVKTFMLHMSIARPLFGFACVPDERERRNRLNIRLQDKYAVQAWVGRDIYKYVPGFYWLTLLPDILARQHGIPLPLVEQVALAHFELEAKQHLFQFYERPDDWSTKANVARLCASLSGVFDIEMVRPQALTATNIFHLNSMLDQWK